MATTLPAVPKVRLGRTGIETTKLGLGSANLLERNWIGRTSDDDYVAMLREAFSLGIRHLDTAPSYDQALFARLLTEAEPPDDVVVVSKVGRYRADDGGLFSDFDPELAVRSVHRSLNELGLERLPILNLHDARPDEWDQIMAPDGTLAALRRLQAEGLVGAIGIAVGNADFAATAAASGEFDIIGSYTLLNRFAARRIHPQARRHDLGVINISPFAGNILATGAVNGARYSYRDASPEILEVVRGIEARATASGVTLPEAALAFSLVCPDVDVSVIGPMTIAELRADVAVLGLRLTREELAAIASPVDFPGYWF